MTDMKNVKKLLRLKDGEELTIGGVVYTMMHYDPGPNQIKVSPCGGAGDFDTDCFWIDATKSELRDYFGGR